MRFQLKQKSLLLNGDCSKLGLVKTSEPPSPTQIHEVIFGVRQNNLEYLKSLLDEVSHPYDPKYGQYLTRAEIGQLTADWAATEAVRAGLMNFESGSITVGKTSLYGEYVKATATLETWEKMFQSKFSSYRMKGEEFVMLPQYSLPAEWADYVTIAFNTVQISEKVFAQRPRHFSADELSDLDIKSSFKSKSSSLPAAELNPAVTPVVVTAFNPQYLSQFYNFTLHDGAGYGSQGVFESINESYSVTDLTMFQTINNLPLQQPSTIIGGHVYQGNCTGGFENCGEANLDVQYLMGLSQSVPTTYWYDSEGLYSWIFTVADTANPPLVLSVSYLSPEAAHSATEASQFNTEAIKLSLQGVSLIMASGDCGASGQFLPEDLPQYCGYNLPFPQTSPYVTTVGGTQGYPETVCSSGTHGTITSGGGFSNLYGRPSWQVDVVQNYFDVLPVQPYQNFSSSTGTFNHTGRGIPDVSMLAAYYELVIDGQSTFAAGTSASTPVFASMIAQINAARLAENKPSLGWLNPTLYLFASSFIIDITEGNNTCLEDTTYCCKEGYLAAPGWDAATGLGSASFSKLFTVLMSVPGAATPGPTTHHQSSTGGFFGIACACFLFAVGMFTYVYNRQHINAWFCGKAPEKDTTASTELL